MSTYVLYQLKTTAASLSSTESPKFNQNMNIGDQRQTKIMLKYMIDPKTDASL